MSDINIEESHAFIQSLELPEPQTYKNMPVELRLSEEDEEAGYVDAGSLVSFVAGVSPQSQSDALNSTLLAQLAANKKFDRETQTEDWYKFYHTVLENVGWVVQAFDFTKFNASGSTFTVNAVIADVLEAIATKDDKAVIDSTIKAVKALDDGDGRLVLWDDNSTKLDKGNFQISSCNESDGVLVMKIGAFHFKTDKRVTGVLWFTFSSSSTSMYKGGQVMTLDLDVYSKVRETIIEKLGSRAQDFVGNLDI